MATAYATTHNLKLSFSSWVCPEWTVAAITDGMQSYGYDGVELRIGKGHLHGVELDSPADYLASVRKQFDAANLAVSCIATSFAFASPDITERQKSIANLKQCLRMSDTLGCPYIRVFGGDVPPGLEPVGVVDYISEALDECAEFAEKEKIRSMILIETNGPFAHTKYTTEVVSQVFSSKLGVLWDLLHPMRVLEPVEDTYDAICDHVRHVHVHEMTYNDDRTKLAACEPGEGIAPLGQVIDLLKSGNFRGYLSVEAKGQNIDPDEILPVYGKLLKGLVKPVAKV